MVKNGGCNRKKGIIREILLRIAEIAPDSFEK